MLRENRAPISRLAPRFSSFLSVPDTPSTDDFVVGGAPTKWIGRANPVEGKNKGEEYIVYAVYLFVSDVK